MPLVNQGTVSKTFSSDRHTHDNPSYMSQAPQARETCKTGSLPKSRQLASPPGSGCGGGSLLKRGRSNTKTGETPAELERVPPALTGPDLSSAFVRERFVRALHPEFLRGVYIGMNQGKSNQLAISQAVEAKSKLFACGEML